MTGQIFWPSKDSTRQNLFLTGHCPLSCRFLKPCFPSCHLFFHPASRASFISFCFNFGTKHMYRKKRFCLQGAFLHQKIYIFFLSCKIEVTVLVTVFSGSTFQLYLFPTFSGIRIISICSVHFKYV